MATLVQSTSGFNASGSNTNLFTSAFGSANTAGNAIIVAVCLDALSATGTLADTQGNTYQLLAEYSGGSATTFGTVLFYGCLNIAGGSGNTVQFTEATALDGQIFAQEWSGLATSNIVDTASGMIINSAATSSGLKLTTTASNTELFCVAMLQSQTNTWSAGTGWSGSQNTASNFTSAGIESQAGASAGSYTGSFGMTNTGMKMILLTVALRTTTSGASNRASGVDMTSAFVNNMTQSSTGFANTFVHQTGSGSNRVMVVSVSAWRNGATATGLSALTYNGAALTKVTGSGQNSTSGAFYTEQWYLVNPDSGLNKLVATSSTSGSTSKLGIAIATFTGVNQSNPIDANVTANNNTTSITASLTTSANSEFMVDAASHLSANNPTSNSNTAIYSDATIGAGLFSQYGTAATAGTNSMSWTMPDNGDEWAYSLLALAVAATPSAVYYPPLRIPNKSVGPMALRYNFRPRTLPAGGYTPQLYLQTYTASLSFTGAQTKQVTRPLSAVTSFTGSVSRAVGRQLSATSSFVGSLTKSYLSSGFTAVLSFTGSVLSGRWTARTLTATTSFSGTQNRQTVHLLTASASFTGNVSRSVVRTLAAVVNFVGSVAKRVTYPLTATTSFAGSFAKQPVKALRASFTANNMVSNGGFESAPPFTASTTTAARWIDGTAGGSATDDSSRWGLITATGSGSVQFDTSNANSGSNSLKVSITGTGSRFEVSNAISASGTSLTTYAFQVRSSTAYTLTYWMKTNYVSGASADGAKMRIIEYNSSFVQGAVIEGTSVQTTTGWTKYTINRTTASTAAYILIRCSIIGNTGTNTLIMDAWFDDISFAAATGSFSRQLSRSLTATTSFTGALKRATAYPLSATLSFTGNVVTGGSVLLQALTASLGFTGSHVKRTARSFIGYFNFSVPPDATGGGLGTGGLGDPVLGGGYSGTLGTGFTKQVNKVISGAASFTGTIERGIGHGLTATLGFTGSVVRQIARGLSASVLFTGNTVKSVAHSFSASLSFTGSAVRRMVKSLVATATFSGSMVRRSSRSLTAALSFTGTQNRATAKGLSATVSFSGSLPKMVARVFTASLSASGAVVRRCDKLLAASVSGTGALTRRAGHSLTATLGLSGGLVRSTARTLAANLTLSGTTTSGRIVRVAITGAVGFSGSISRQFQKLLTAQVSFRTLFIRILRRIIRRGKPIILHPHDGAIVLRPRDDRSTLHNHNDKDKVL